MPPLHRPFSVHSIPRIAVSFHSFVRLFHLTYYTVRSVRLFSMHFSLVKMNMQKCIVNSPYNRLIMFVWVLFFFSTLSSCWRNCVIFGSNGMRLEQRSVCKLYAYKQPWARMCVCVCTMHVYVVYIVLPYLFWCTAAYDVVLELFDFLHNIRISSTTTTPCHVCYYT